MFTLTEIAVAICVGAAIGTVQAGNILGTAVTQCYQCPTTIQARLAPLE